MQLTRTSHVALIAVGLALALGGCSRGEARAGAGKLPPVPVAVGTSTRADVPIEVSAIATAKAYSIVTLRPQVSGIALKKFFTPGQHVDKGHVLYQLDPRPFEIALSQAQATLARDQAAATIARTEANNTRDLLARGAANPFEADRKEAQAKAAEATVAADQAAVNQAKLNIEYCTIASPIDGYVGPTLTDAGNVVKMNETDLVVLRQVRPIYVELAVPQDRLPAIQAAMAREGGVTLEVQIPQDNGPPERGKLLFVNNTVDEETGTITLRGLFENPSLRLWPGRYVRASMVLGVEKDAVLVPTPALQTGQNGSFVYIVKPDNTVQPVSVTPGRDYRGRTVVRGGLEPDTTVVTDGHLRLTPGATVQIAKSGGGEPQPASAPGQVHAKDAS